MIGQRLAGRLGKELGRGQLGSAKNTHAHADRYTFTRGALRTAEITGDITVCACLSQNHGNFRL